MAVTHEPPVCLAVLNPKGRDPYIDYAEGVGGYEAGVHAPINFHAYAAASRGAFFDSTEEVLKQRDRFTAVVVLIRRRTWISLRAVDRLSRAGMKVLVSWKECSHDQVARQLESRRAVAAYGRILQLADGIISPTLALPPRCGEISQEEFREKLKFIPTPYPIDYPSWDFSVPVESREGIMIGTRDFRTISRNHIQAIARVASMAHDLSVPRVSVINTDGRWGLGMLKELEKSFPRGVLNIVPRPLPYPEYMRLLSSHRLVYQMDRSLVPGQVAGDSLLARTICAGGSSTIERMAFSSFREDVLLRTKGVLERITRVLRSDQSARSAIANSQRAAAESLTFAASATLFAKWEILR